ncbi:hypothetical protein STEG23_005068 [Scotinomys teguina]
MRITRCCTQASLGSGAQQRPTVLMSSDLRKGYSWIYVRRHRVITNVPGKYLQSLDFTGSYQVREKKQMYLPNWEKRQGCKFLSEEVYSERDETNIIINGLSDRV